MPKDPRPDDGERPVGQAPDADDRELLAIVRSEPRDSPQHEAACQALVSRYQWLVATCVRRYRGGPELAEDLMQVGYVGLLKAINNFDPGVGRSLAAYAQPCITGEIKRYFRDKRWQVHVERPVQERLLEVREPVYAGADLTISSEDGPHSAAVERIIAVLTDRGALAP